MLGRVEQEMKVEVDEEVPVPVTDVQENIG
jgi:hypothetical protein